MIYHESDGAIPKKLMWCPKCRRKYDCWTNEAVCPKCKDSKTQYELERYKGDADGTMDRN